MDATESCRTCREKHPDHPELWCWDCRHAFATEFPRKMTAAESCRAYEESWDFWRRQMEAVGRANCPAEVP